jgi:hypothetical protein
MYVQLQQIWYHATTGPEEPPGQVHKATVLPLPNLKKHGPLELVGLLLLTVGYCNHRPG